MLRESRQSAKSYRHPHTGDLLEVESRASIKDHIFEEQPIKDSPLKLKSTLPSNTKRTDGTKEFHGAQTRRGGIAYRQLTVYGHDSASDHQTTLLTRPLLLADCCFRSQYKSKKTILDGFEGLVNRGQMLLVLGRAGSGCTTLLKTLAGHGSGFSIDENSRLSYRGEFSAI